MTNLLMALFLIAVVGFALTAGAVLATALDGEPSRCPPDSMMQQTIVVFFKSPATDADREWLEECGFGGVE